MTEGLRQRTPRLEVPALRELARGMPCMIQSSVCNQNPATTVWCHSNQGADGKGMSMKADDFAGVFGCSDCHRFIDEARNADIAEFLFRQAWRRTQRFCWENGIFRIDDRAVKAVRHYG
jgi:hypothetical protein